MQLDDTESGIPECANEPESPVYELIAREDLRVSYEFGCFCREEEQVPLDMRIPLPDPRQNESYRKTGLVKMLKFLPAKFKKD